MSNNKTERIASIEERIEQLQNQKKKLIQAQRQVERKARTKRLIERGAILESLIDNVDTLNNEQIQTFLKKTIQTPFANKILAEVQGELGR